MRRHAAACPGFLSAPQQVGVELFEALQQRISRAEVEEIVRVGPAWKVTQKY